MQPQLIAILLLTLVGFALRLYYLTSSHPFFDEYTTVLAARQILRHGWPVLPSGLFYEHGLLATYLIAPFTALFISIPQSEWQPAHWGLMLSRWPSVLVSTITIPTVFAVGRWAELSTRQHQAAISSMPLLAAGLFALAPEGIVWGGRARMYALATLLVLLTVFWAYRGAVFPASAKYRWLALVALLATLLTQFGAMMLIPPLVVAMPVIGWLSWRKQIDTQSRAWFLRLPVLFEIAALTAIIAIAILVKRLGQPLGAAALGDSQSGNLAAELFNTVAYQSTLHFTWPDTVEILARQFGVSHHYWLALLAVIGGVTAIVLFFLKKPAPNGNRVILPDYPGGTFSLFVWVVFGLIILEMVTLLEPFRRNPRYIVMYLPLFYLVAAASISYLITLAIYVIQKFTHSKSLTSAVRTHRPARHDVEGASVPDHTSRISNLVSSVIAMALLTLFFAIGYNDLRIAIFTPEPAYEQAFAKIYADIQPGDTLLTMNTPAAELYLNHIDGFTVQNDADQFLLNADTNPVDRWAGKPWVGTAIDFNAAINATPQSWFVIDTIRQPVYFGGDWQAVLNSQMEQVWASDNAIIYRTRPDRVPLPTIPQVEINATLGDSIELLGYAVETSNQPTLTLFWQPLVSPETDYTTFVHLRNNSGDILVQRDGQPLEGTYPTSHWQPGEIVIDPIPLPPDIPAGEHIIYVGLYRLDTLQRLPVANDASGENAVILGEVQFNE